MNYKTLKRSLNTEKIEAAIAQFESIVDFELVPVIAAKSSFTSHLSGLIFFPILLLSSLSLGLASIYFSELGIIHLSNLFFGLGILWASSVVLSWWPWLQRRLIFNEERCQQVKEKAQNIFWDRQLHATKTHQGLLLYISVMEHRIVILPDPKSVFKGSDKLSEECLHILQKNFKNDEYEKGLLEMIEHLSVSLKDQFPQTSSTDKEDELCNKLIWLD